MKSSAGRTLRKSFTLSSERYQQLGVHAIMYHVTESELVEALILAHLNDYVVVTGQDVSDGAGGETDLNPSEHVRVLPEWLEQVLKPGDR